MSSDSPPTAIRIEGLSKRYRLGARFEQSDTLVGSLGSIFGRPVENFRRLRRLHRFEGQEEDVVWALDGVDLEMAQGEVVGLVGRNGAGKSTLLKILSRITAPTAGRIELQGRVASLLEVGTGFHAELTGRENVYLNGTILGMTRREIDRKFDEIVAFSGIERFLDTPVKRYSSGMSVRLAFSVAAHLEAEILLVDEVLAVGDAAFQKKCLGKMGDVARAGRTVLLVSHNMSSILRFCPRSYWLNDGKILLEGPSSEVVHAYLRGTMEGDDGTGVLDFEVGGLRVVAVTVASGAHASETSTVAMGDPFQVNLSLRGDMDPDRTHIAVIVEDAATAERIFTLATDSTSLHPLTGADYATRLACAVPELRLIPGSYAVTVSMTVRGETAYLEQVVKFDVLPSDVYGTGVIPARNRGMVFERFQWSRVDEETS